MVSQLRADLVFPTWEAAECFFLLVDHPTLYLARVRVEDLGYQLPPIIMEHELLRIHFTANMDNCFSTPLQVSVNENLWGSKERLGVQAEFLSVIDVNLFLQFRGVLEEVRSLGSLRC